MNQFMNAIIQSACLCFTLLAGSSALAANEESLTVFVAKKIITMDSTNPEATAVAVRGARVVAVGSMESLKPWLEAYPHEVDETFANLVLMPGLIDPHLHPLLGAIQLKTHWVTPESWSLHDEVVTGVRSPEAFNERLRALLAEHSDPSELFIVWGWSEPYHGPMTRDMLDELAPDRPVMMWQRSVHEAVFNSAALDMMALTESDVTAHPSADQVDWESAHFIEGGFFDIAVPRLAPMLLAPDFIDAGFRRNFDYFLSKGVTTVGDMATGSLNWEMELAALQRKVVDRKTPVRVVLVPDAYKIIAQKGGFDAAYTFIEAQLTAPDLPAPLEGGKRIKLFADGAMFSLLMALNEPGYVGFGHNEWITPQAEFKALAEKYWLEGFKIYVHTNGDAGAAVDLGQSQLGFLL